VRFVWHRENVTHIAGHGLTVAAVEAVFESEDLGIAESGRAGRWIAEGSVLGRTIRVAFTLSGPEEIHVITAYPIGLRRRRT
jgi:uncharacterized DUF497 family protein